jgi:hypothetical protein
VHNQRSGDPKPSREDTGMTKKIKKASEALGIAIHDHPAIGRKGHASFRSLGLLRGSLAEICLRVVHEGLQLGRLLRRLR